MIVNLSEYIKNIFFSKKSLNNTIILSDSDINTLTKFEKFDIFEPVGQILARSKDFKNVIVVLDKVNWDNLYRLYKYNLNVTIINLNSGYTGLGKKNIFADMDDVYIKSNTDVLEPFDLKSFENLFVDSLSKKGITHIRIPNKEMQDIIGNSEIQFEYSEIIDFREYGISGYNGAILCYGSMFQETLNAVGLLQADGLGFDFFWIGNYKLFSLDLVKKLDMQDTIFIVGDFDQELFKTFIYSKFFEFDLSGKLIYFILPQNLRNVLPEILSEQVKMQPMDIYNRIYSKIK